MGSIDRDLQGIYDAERKAARTPTSLVDAVAGRAGRRRSSAIVGTAVATLVGVGLLAALGMTLARNSEPITVPEGSIEVPLIVARITTLQEDGLGLSDYCGQAPPQVAPITEEFTLTAQIDTLTDDLSTDVQFFTGGELASEDGLYHSEKRDILSLATRIDAVSSITAGWLFVQDGIVVGYVDGVAFSDDQPTGLRVWTDGGSTSLPANTAVAISCAPDTGRSRWDPYRLTSSTILPAGEYEAYPIVRIDTSPELDALHALIIKGVAPLLVSDYAIGSPGSWDCQQAIESTGLTPIDCVEGLYDPSRGVATVIVPPALQSPILHVTLVGVPVPYSRTGVVVERDWFEAEPGSEPSPSPTDVPDFYTCTPEQGESFWAGRESLSEVVFLEGSAIIDPPPTGPSYATSVEVLGMQEDDGTFSDAVDLGVTLSVHQEGMELGDVGFALATINDGAPVVLDRHSGSTNVTLTLSEITWCGQPLPEGTELEAQADGSAFFTPKGGDERKVTIHMWITPYGLADL